MSGASNNASGGYDGFRGGFRGGFPGGFRVFTVGRDAASRFRVRPPWRARANAGFFERAFVGLLTFLLAVPIAVLLLALGVMLLAAFLGCAAIFVALGIAMWLVRRVFGVGLGRDPRSASVRIRRVDEEPFTGSAARGDDRGRENVRVLPRQDPEG